MLTNSVYLKQVAFRVKTQVVFVFRWIPTPVHRWNLRTKELKTGQASRSSRDSKEFLYLAFVTHVSTYTGMQMYIKVNMFRFLMCVVNYYVYAMSTIL